MRLLRGNQLVLSECAPIGNLLEELISGQVSIEAEAAEIVPNTHVSIKSVKDNYFIVETETLPDDVLAVPLSSWRLTVALQDATLSLTTVSLARVDSRLFALMYPDEIVSGRSRRYYRVKVEGENAFQVSLQTPGSSEPADIIDASFSGMLAELHYNSNAPFDAGTPLIVVGRQRGILFKEKAKVVHRNGQKLGIEMVPEGCSHDESPWSHVVRRLAYDTFMKHLRVAA